MAPYCSCMYANVRPGMGTYIPMFCSEGCSTHLILFTYIRKCRTWYCSHTCQKVGADIVHIHVKRVPNVFSHTGRKLGSNIIYLLTNGNMWPKILLTCMSRCMTRYFARIHVDMCNLGYGHVDMHNLGHIHVDMRHLVNMHVDMYPSSYCKHVHVGIYYLLPHSSTYWLT